MDFTPAQIDEPTWWRNAGSLHLDIMTKDVEQLVREQSDRLHEALTRRDFASIAPLFTPEAVWEVAPPYAQQFHGPTNIAEGVRKSVEQLEVLSHKHVPAIIEIRGVNYATAETSTEDHIRFHDGREVRVAGRYVDLFLTYRGTWRYAHRVFQAKSIDRLR
jgi:ketosteroid isomerase-like protein